MRVWLSRICLLVAGSLTVLALVAPSVAADERPPAFHATGFASAIQAMVNTNPQTFVADLVRMDIPHGQSQFGADGVANARAASLFPGVGAAEGPALAWEQACSRGFPCKEFFPDGGFPPPFPLASEAENPTRPSAQPTVEGQQIGEAGGPVSYTLLKVEATATADEATTTAVISDLNLFPVDPVTPVSNPSAVHIAKLYATTDLHIEGDDVVAQAESRLDDVSLFGGAIEIEQVVARSVSRANAAGVKTNAPEVVILGATAGGTPVEITDQGIKVAGSAQDQGAIPTLSNGVGNLFGAGPLSVRLIDSTTDIREGTARAGAVGLGVHIELNASGFPSGTTLVTDLILGTASTSAFADDDAFSGDDLTFDDTFSFGDETFFADEFDGTGGFDDTSVLGETLDAGFDEGAGDDTESAAPVPRPDGGTVQRFEPLEALLRGAAAQRVELLYIAWTLALVALALASRLRPIRFATHR